MVIKLETIPRYMLIGTCTHHPGSEIYIYIYILRALSISTKGNMHDGFLFVLIEDMILLWFGAGAISTLEVCDLEKTIAVKKYS